MKDFLLDVHAHTVASGHAYSTIYETIQVAKSKGLKLVGISDHGPAMPGTAYIFYFQNLRVVPREIEGIRVLRGVEANILDYNGTIDMNPADMEVLDYAIASMHQPCLTVGSKKENTRALTEAMKNPLVKIIGHPDDMRYPLDYETVVKAAKDNHVLLEINNSSLNPTGFRLNAQESIAQILELSVKYDHPVIVNSDAHIAFDIGNFGYAKAMIEKVHFPESLIINCDVDRFLSWMNIK